MKYYNKFLVLFIVNVICVLIVQFIRTENSGKLLITASSTVVNNEIQNAIETSDVVKTNRKVLIICDTGDNSDVLTKQAKEMQNRLTNMKMESQLIKDTELTDKSFNGYECVIVMSDEWDNSLSKHLYGIIKFAEDGGKVMFGVVSNSLEGSFKGIYRSLGIMTYTTYESIQGFKFNKELMTGSKGMSFVEESDFGNICINLEIDEQECQLYMSSDGAKADIPLLWSKPCGSGNIVVFNSTGLGDRYFAGIFAGAMAVLEDDLIYPIINAKTVFLDDFPAPQYNVYSATIKNNYNRSVKEFYRDIWWPDMQKAANQYDYSYTGLFITSYENNVKNYEIVEDSNFEYYGNSLLKNGFEIGLHGYNHQSLALKGFVPKEMGYVPWESEEDMISAINTLDQYAERLFPSAKITVYVPPSNYLSPEGREALVKSDSDLAVISGVYDAEENEYQQDFVIAADGIVEFPRLTSGMWNDTSIQLQYMCGITMYGVFSHFLHPDDILDAERGKDSDWETLYKGYTEILKSVNDASPLRGLKASEAGEAMKVYNNLKIEVEYEEDYIKGACDNFTGEAYFYIRTAKTPLSTNDSCVIEKADKKNGEFFYLVTIKKPEFEIKLEDQ